MVVHVMEVFSFEQYFTALVEMYSFLERERERVCVCVGGGGWGGGGEYL